MRRRVKRRGWTPLDVVRVRGAARRGDWSVVDLIASQLGTDRDGALIEADRRHAVWSAGVRRDGSSRGPSPWT